MSKLKRWGTIALSTLFVGGAVAGFAACDKKEKIDADYIYDITVWVGDDTLNLTKEMIDEFNKTNEYRIYFKANIQEVTESKAGGDVMNNLAAAPEIFCFAQDQIARLVHANALAKPFSTVETALKAEHSETSIAAASVGGTLYAYPLTEDNGYFLYYDTRVISATQAQSIEGIMSAIEAASTPSKNYNFSFKLDGTGSGWYAASFFYAKDEQGNSLCKSEWTVDAQGRFTGYEDTFDNNPNGYIAAKGMQKVSQKTAYYSSNGAASDFTASSPAAAVVSGIWDYKAAKAALGNNLGVAKLPTFTVDGNTYQLSSYLGCKLIGVTPQSDGNKTAALAYLAQYLANSANQLKRYEAVAWGPTAKTAQTNANVTADVALSALKASATVNQGQYPYDWWTASQALALAIKNAASDDTLTTAFANYKETISTLVSSSSGS